MPEKKSAKERKAEIQEKSREAVKVSRRNSRVVVHKVAPEKHSNVTRKHAKTNPLIPVMAKPKGLSAEAKWDAARDEYGLRDIHVLDWFRLYPGENEEEWPDYIEEIRALHADGLLDTLLKSQSEGEE